MDLSLARIRRLTSLLPRYTRPTIHIAGTNGKGSTSAFLDSILRQAGFLIGRFNSPHLVTTRDSILLDGHPISPDDYNQAFQSVVTADEIGDCRCTNFELQTATALLVFERGLVDVAILEVGLGGRLDATNVIPDDVVLVSGIASIDLDHQAILGDTLELIAREKAGIARAGRPCVLGDQSAQEVIDTVQKLVSAAGGHIIYASKQVQVLPGHRLANDITLPPPATRVTIRYLGEQCSATLGLQGIHQVSNAKLSVAVVEALMQTSSLRRVSPEQVRQGLSLATWPGRLEWIDYSTYTTRDRNGWLLVDGAHNPGSTKALAQYLSSLPIARPRSFVVSVSKSPLKSPQSTLGAILLPGDRVAVVPFSPVDGMPWVKPHDPAVLLQAAEELVGSSGEAIMLDNLGSALNWAADGHSVVVVTGSLYLIADLYRLLQL
ncbi:folylpolyglutamate synthase [Tulasnella sp. 417]|nr:folylpolyglutamate synthase [Tulasnella sp. 417]